MENALFLIAGTYLSCVLTKWYHFKELRCRLYEAIIAATTADALAEFLRNSRCFHEKMFPVQIAFYAMGHVHAARQVAQLADRMECDMGELLANPPPGRYSGHSIELRFILNARDYMRDSDIPANAEKVPFTWEGLLNPL